MNRRNIFLAILAMVGAGVSQIDAVQRLVDAGEVVPVQNSKGPSNRSPESLREGLVAVVVDLADKVAGVEGIIVAMCNGAIGSECMTSWAGALAMPFCRVSDGVEVASGDLWQVTPDQFAELQSALTPRNKYLFLRKTSPSELKTALLTLPTPLKNCDVVAQ